MVQKIQTYETCIESSYIERLKTYPKLVFSCEVNKENIETAHFKNPIYPGVAVEAVHKNDVALNLGKQKEKDGIN